MDKGKEAHSKETQVASCACWDTCLLSVVRSKYFVPLAGDQPGARPGWYLPTWSWRSGAGAEELIQCGAEELATGMAL